ncbi:MAG: hypothetical protein EU550_03825 [Promethearchaeota archaeon]|nr:MAG: hypothetical protein EU550_03825 [Candidatus Lokiarchaeota archaeon]
MLRKRDFYHQRIKYSFHYHANRIDKLSAQNHDLKYMAQYFKRVYNGKIPNQLFNSHEIQRISRFKIKGIKRAFLNSFSKKLIRSEKILTLDPHSDLPAYAKKVYESYKKNSIPSKPGHDPVLKNILIKNENAVAIEVPIWKKKNNNFLTGHIDLIQIENNLIKIIDYKPEGNFLYSLPQVATYGLISKEILGLDAIKCISFNKNEAWQYDPLILLTDIKKYLMEKGYNKRPWEDFL